MYQFIVVYLILKNDPIKQLVIKHLGSQEISKRQLPNADSVVCDVNGLQILIVNNHFFKLHKILIKFDKINRNVDVFVVLLI